MDILSETALRVSQYAPNSRMAPHTHAESSLIVVLSGDYREIIRHNDTLHRPGDVLYYPAQARHEQTFGVEGARKVVFSPTHEWQTYLQQHVPELEDAPQVHSPHTRFLGNQLVRELDRIDEFSELACEGILSEMIATFGRSVREERIQPVPWVAAVRDRLREDFEQNLTLAELALQSGRHPVHLAREFRRCYGTSVGEYRRLCRVEAAADHLLTTELDIAEIALLSGFSSQSHLCRVFKTIYGLAPEAFRRKNSKSSNGSR